MNTTYNVKIIVPKGNVTISDLDLSQVACLQTAFIRLKIEHEIEEFTSINLPPKKCTCKNYDEQDQNCAIHKEQK